MSAKINLATTLTATTREKRAENQSADPDASNLGRRLFY
jgi:hypothetical protein